MKGATHTIRYRYTCEKCGGQTEWMDSEIEEQTETSGAMELVSAVADKNRFKRQLQKFRAKVEGGEYDYHFMGGMACPFCGHHQSWLPVAGRLLKPAARVALYMCGWMFVGLILVVGVPILQREADMLEWMPDESWIALFFAPILAGLWLALRRNRINRRRNEAQQAAVIVRNKPEIDWNGI